MPFHLRPVSGSMARAENWDELGNKSRELAKESTSSFHCLLTANGDLKLLSIGGSKGIGHHALIASGTFVANIGEPQIAIDGRLIGVLIVMNLSFSASAIVQRVALHNMLIIVSPSDL